MLIRCVVAEFEDYVQSTDIVSVPYLLGEELTNDFQGCYAKALEHYPVHRRLLLFVFSSVLDSDQASAGFYGSLADEMMNRINE